ncbi:hypothetical protein H8959_018908 [Pygathrix nigripes]
MALPTPQTFRPWSLNSNYGSFTEENHVSACHHSISAQTSKHLFWANKLIQASENSLQRAINMQLNNGSAGQPISSRLREAIPTDALCSKEQLQSSDARSAPLATSSQEPSPLLSSDLPPPIGLAELITFASSLAMASSSRADMPSLEHMMKAPPQEALELSTEPLLITAEEQEPEKHAETLPEKPREARAPLKSWSQEDKNFTQSYFDFSKPGIKRATIEGQMQLLQPPATSPVLPGGKEDLTSETPQQLAAFQDIFKLFSCSPTGTVDMHSMKGALGNVGIQLSPQETFEALRQADLDGVGIVSLSDFLGVFNDNHRLAQCMGRVTNSQVCDPQGLQTLFFEMLFKLLGRGFVPSKLAQEVMRTRSEDRLLLYLLRAPTPGARSPYSQIPNLEGSALPERRTRSPAAGPGFRLTQPY